MIIYSLDYSLNFCGKRNEQKSATDNHTVQKQFLKNIPEKQNADLSNSLSYLQDEENLRISVTDFDSVIKLIKRKINGINERNIERRANRTTRIIRNKRVRPEICGKYTKVRIKDLSLIKLKDFHDNHTDMEIIEFHASKNSKGQNLFVRIFRQRGKIFSVNSYVKELLTLLKDYPNEIAKILTVKDIEKNIMPVLFLSYDNWNVLLSEIFSNADEKYLSLIKEEIATNQNAYNSNIQVINFIKSKIFRISEEGTYLVGNNKKNAATIYPTYKNPQVQKNVDVSTIGIPITKIVEDGIVSKSDATLAELIEFIKQQKSIGNLFWSYTKYKNSQEPILFTIASKIAESKEESLCEYALEEIKRNSDIDVNVKNKEGIPFFAKLLILKNVDLIDAVKDKKIEYHPIFDDLAENIKDELLLSKLKECDVNFKYINDAAQKKSLSSLKEIFNSLDSIFYSREKSGKYVFQSVLNTKDQTFICEFWKQFYKFIPRDSSKIISEII